MRSQIWALAAGVAGLIAAAGSARAQGDAKAVVATVNGRTITFGEVDTVLRARNVSPAELPPDSRKRMQYEAACLLVDGILWEQYLQKNGPHIDPAELNK